MGKGCEGRVVSAVHGADRACKNGQGKEQGKR